VGQSLTEYAIIVFLIAVGTIGVVGLFGNNLRSLFSAGSDALAGETTVEPGAAKTTSGLTKWSMQGGGSDGFNSGGVMNRPGPGGNPGGPGGNPGGTSNSSPVSKE
jgi:Flp pilus assembly pilin Flp